MESTQKKQKIETETTDCRQPQNTLSPFNFPDFTIKIADKKLHIDRGDLIEMSPVFRTMLTADFKEKDAREIELPDKDPTTFALFLRHTLPGFDGLILPEETARLILPLVHEYQTDTSLIKIDRVLTKRMEGKKYKCPPEELIDEILKAELYFLPRYLTACIAKAFSFSHKTFVTYPKFNEISGDTKYKIFSMRCTQIESQIGRCIQVIDEFQDSPCFDCESRDYSSKAQRILNSISY